MEAVIKAFCLVVFIAAELLAEPVLNDFNNTELELPIGCLKRSPNEINPFKCVSRSCDHLVTDLGLRLVRWFAVILRLDPDTVASEAFCCTGSPSKQCH